MPETLKGLWKERLSEGPHAIALECGETGQRWSRWDIAGLVKRELVERNLEGSAEWIGRRVVLSVRSGVQWWTGFLGLLELGAIPVLVDPQDGEDVQRSKGLKLGATGFWGSERFESLLPDGRGRQRRIRGDAGVALVKVTSGSTGEPKGLAFTDAQMIADGLAVCRGMGIEASDSHLAAIPFGHSYGLGNLVLPLLLLGTPLVMVGSGLPQVIAEAVRLGQPTIFPAVPILLRGLVESGLGAEALAGVRLVVSAGAILKPELAQTFGEKFGTVVHNFYGSSETGGICYDVSGEATWMGRSIGTPLPGVQVEVGSTGRIEVQSAAVMGKGRMQLADRGCWNKLGELVLEGRVGRMVKIGGKRLELGEVEKVIREIGAIEVRVLEQPERLDALVAVVQLDKGVDLGKLRGLVKERLPGWKVPKSWVVLDEFPMTIRGKVDLGKVEQLVRERFDKREVKL